MPYNELIVTVDHPDNALNRAAAELSSDDARGIAIDLHRLDGVSRLVDVLQWALGCARARGGDASLSIVRGSRLEPWRPGAGQLPGRQRFALNVGGRVVAVLLATPPTSSAAAALDILTSYASRTLESMTLHKALGLIPPRIDRRITQASVAAYLR